MRRLLLIASVALSGSACATQPGTSRSTSESAFADRAATIAQAWHATLTGPAGQTWRSGLIPLQDLTIAPDTALNEDLAFAFSQGWYSLATSLPPGDHDRGTVSFPDGTSLSLPVVNAVAAYQAMHKGDPPCSQSQQQPPTGLPSPATGPTAGGPVGTVAPHTCARLTITDVKAGTTTLRTSRGAATVPAWLFTVRELPVPIARAAIATQETMTYPTFTPMDQPGRLASVSKLKTANDRQLEFTIGIGACDRNPTGLAYETDEAVVIGGRTDQPRGSTCDNSLVLQPVSVSLKQTLGSRAVFDAVSGRVLIQTNARY